MLLFVTEKNLYHLLFNFADNEFIVIVLLLCAIQFIQFMSTVDVSCVYNEQQCLQAVLSQLYDYRTSFY